jgi:hypothetical protein
MIKGKPWEPATLKEVGGAEGVGVTFLEETFGAAHAPPEHRLHQKAARAVLHALLPEQGTDIKGHMRSYAELLAASGYDSRPREFNDLLHILDAELRLVTPTEAEQVENDGQKTPTPLTAHQLPLTTRHYQLTHDYLVPALRQWLTSKQKETWRGRAELRLGERAAQWTTSKQRRFLPSLVECGLLSIAVPSTKRTVEQKLLLRSAAKHHALTWGSALIVLLAGTFGIQKYVASVHNAKEAGITKALVDSLLAAPPSEVQGAIKTLEPHREHARQLLRDRFSERGAEYSQGKLHAALGLAELGGDDEALMDFLLNQVPDAPPAEAKNVMIAFAGVDDSSRSRLLERVRVEKDPKKRARYALTLLHQGDTRGAELLSALAPDPTCRTAFVHGLREWHGDLRPLAEALRTNNAPFRSALCSALGFLDSHSVGENERQAVSRALLAVYEHSSDGGTHSASGWALKRWQLGLPALQPTRHPTVGRDWFVNRQQMTMLRIPSSQDGQDANNAAAHSLFMCDREVWVDLYYQFMKDPDPACDKPQNWKEFQPSVSLTGDCPVDSVSWFDAVLFCNWLSRREERRPCYTLTRRKASNQDGEIQECACDWTADGYRLPTVREWESACRTNCSTLFSFGNDISVISDYGWLLMNSQGRAWPGGGKLCNAWGFFDMYGNVLEWCWDSADKDRLCRGGHFLSADARQAAAAPARTPPHARFNLIGFRVLVRTDRTTPAKN